MTPGVWARVAARSRHIDRGTDVGVAGQLVHTAGGHRDDARQLGRRDPAVVADFPLHGGVRRPVRADVVDLRVTEVVRLVARGGDDDDAPLLRVPGGVQQVLEDGALLGLALAVVQIGVGEQAEVHHVEALVTGVAESGGDGVGEAVAGDGARLEDDDVAFGATPPMPTPLIRPAMVVATWVP